MISKKEYKKAKKIVKAYKKQLLIHDVVCSKLFHMSSGLTGGGTILLTGSILFR